MDESSRPKNSRQNRVRRNDARIRCVPRDSPAIPRSAEPEDDARVGGAASARVVFGELGGDAAREFEVPGRRRKWREPAGSAVLMAFSHAFVQHEHAVATKDRSDRAEVPVLALGQVVRDQGMENDVERLGPKLGLELVVHYMV